MSDTPPMSPRQKQAREKLQRIQATVDQLAAEADSVEAALQAAHAEVAQADAWQAEVVQYAQANGFRDLAHAEKKLAKDKNPNAAKSVLEMSPAEFREYKARTHGIG